MHTDTNTNINAKEQLEKLLDVHQRAVTALRASALDLLRPIFKEFFENSPEVKMVTWTQYAPFFNDGEACVFSVNDIEMFGSDDVDEDDYESYISTYDHPAGRQLGQLIQSIPEEVMQDIFGTDSKIVVTAEGITIDDEYDHE